VLGRSVVACHSLQCRDAKPKKMRSKIREFQHGFAMALYRGGNNAIPPAAAASELCWLPPRCIKVYTAQGTQQGDTSCVLQCGWKASKAHRCPESGALHFGNDDNEVCRNEDCAQTNTRMLILHALKYRSRKTCTRQTEITCCPVCKKRLLSAVK
jgi:hypothetical protein